MHNGGKVYLDSYIGIAWMMDHVSWSLGLFSKKHLWEVVLTQNKEIVAL
jgi:hypothetical protein